MTAVLLSLAAACCWGCADFLGGLQSKRVAVPVVLAVVESVGLAGVGERIKPWQRAGVVAAFAGIAMVAGG